MFITKDLFSARWVHLHDNWLFRTNTQAPINSLWPSDAIWRHTSWSTLVRVMACCLTAPSHYLDQCLLYITEVLWQPPESNFTASAQATILRNEFENFTSKIIVGSSRGQWVNFDQWQTMTITNLPFDRKSCSNNGVDLLEVKTWFD